MSTAAGESSANGRTDPASLAALTTQLALLLAVVHSFKIERDAGLLRLTPILLGGFLLHALAPLRYRQPLFLALSLAGILMVLGPVPAGLLIGTGLVLIGACHLPGSLATRVTVLLGLGAALAVMRTGWIDVGSRTLAVVLPVLGAMFMFRLALYLYDTRHEKEPATLWQRLTYFFMLPNICFLLFPVVDYSTMRRTYYQRPARAVYEQGLRWMFRGVVHLLFYRIIYLHFLPAPAEITGLGGVIQSMVATYALYLRVSGQFHVIVGMMGLFGYDLPETHHHYFLASSFNDYWRRINIYWKDFMMKMVFYPVFMRSRRFSMGQRITIATVVVFVSTWILHSYQWFWLQGDFPWRLSDGVFWGVLGGLVVWNSLREAQGGGKRGTAPHAGFEPAVAIRHSLRVVGMLCTLTVLWSMWSSPSLPEWADMVAQASNGTPTQVALLALSLTGLVLLGVVVQYAQHRGVSLSPYGTSPSFGRASLVTAAGLLSLLALGQPGVQRLLGQTSAEAIASIQDSRLNEQDVASMERGYYEGLLQHRQGALRFRAGTQRPENWVNIHQSDIARRTGNMLDYELVPDYRGEFLGSAYSANSAGMRDQAYATEKPNNVVRVALLGSSYEMGSGVTNTETYEARLELLLNESIGSDGPRVEILNFAVNGYSVLQNAVVALEKIAPFQPDIVLLAGHSAEDRRLMDALRRLFRRSNSVDFPWLQVLIAKGGVVPEMSTVEIERRLSPYVQEIIALGYAEVAGAARSMGAIPVWAFVPRTSEAPWMADRNLVAELFRTAEKAGFEILDLRAAYRSTELEDLRVAAWDSHPSALGHELLAAELYRRLTETELWSRVAVPQ